LVAAKLAEEAGEHKPKGEARKEKRVVWLLPPLLIGCAVSLKCIYFKPFNLLWFGGKKKAAEKGHVIPKDHLDSKEKELIKVATKGGNALFSIPCCFAYLWL